LKNWQQEIRKNQKLIIYGIITLCILIANFNLFFKPTISSLKKTTPQLRDLQRKLNSARKDVANMPMYKTQIEDMRNKLSSTKKRFSTKQEISSLLKGLSDIAKESGVKIIGITPHAAVSEKGQAATASTYQKFPISIRATCGYHQLGYFLNDVENSDTFMRVADIRISVDSQAPNRHMVFIVLNTYILNEA